MDLPDDPSLFFVSTNIDGQDNATLSDNDPVCTWTDLGSLGVNATSSSTACPTFNEAGGPGGRDDVTFDGGDTLFTGEASFAALAQPNLIVAVGNVGAAAGSGEPFFDGDTSARRQQAYGNSGTMWLHGGSAVSTGLSLSLNTWHVAGGTFNGASSVGYIDGSTANVAAGTNAPQGLRIGTRYDGGTSVLQGGMALVAVYDTPPAGGAGDVDTWAETHFGVSFPAAGSP